jgi:hypothetical protein
MRNCCPHLDLFLMPCSFVQTPFPSERTAKKDENRTKENKKREKI